jgi:hypothetical protein
MTTRSITTNARYAAAGLAGGLAGALAMNLFARAARAMNEGHEAAGAGPGSDRDGRGVRPPQAEFDAGDDAAVRAGKIVYHALTGHRPSRDVEAWLGTGAHYAFGAALGVCYGLASRRVPSLRAGVGLLYGTLVWAVADEAVVPAGGFSRPPDGLPPELRLHAWCGHWIYGTTLDAVVRMATGEPAALSRSELSQRFDRLPDAL